MMKILVFDVALLAVLLAALNPTITGFAPHEWIGLCASAALLVHVAIRLPELERMARASRKPAALGALLASIALFVLLAICTVSGLMISGTVLPALGLFAPGYLVWNPAHAMSAKAILALGAVHVVIHLPRLTSEWRKGSPQAPRKRKGASGE